MNCHCESVIRIPTELHPRHIYCVTERWGTEKNKGSISMMERKTGNRILNPEGKKTWKRDETFHGKVHRSVTSRVDAFKLLFFELNSKTFFVKMAMAARKAFIEFVKTQNLTWINSIFSRACAERSNPRNANAFFPTDAANLFGLSNLKCNFWAFPDFVCEFEISRRQKLTWKMKYLNDNSGWWCRKWWTNIDVYPLTSQFLSRSGFLNPILMTCFG